VLHLLLHFDINLQCAAQTGHEQIGLLPFGDVVATGKMGEELVDEVVDRARPMKLSELAEGVAADGGPEATVDGLNELRPRWNAAVALKPKVPSGGCLVQVEGRRPGLVRLRGAIGEEALFALVQPDRRIVLAVVVGELELVCWRLMGRRRVGSGRLELVRSGLLQNLGLDPVDGDVQGGVLVLDLADLMGVALDRAEEVVELGADVRWNLIPAMADRGGAG